MIKEEEKSYTGRIIEKTIYVNGNIQTNAVITLPRSAFLLDRYDFDKIIKGESALRNLTNFLFGATIGLLINMLAKLIGSKMSANVSFDEWELYAFVIALVLALACFFLDKVCPNERRDIVKKIKRHYEND